MDVDHRHADGQAVAHFLVGADGGTTVANDPHVEAGAAHVTADDVAVSRRRGGVGGGFHPGRRSGHERVDGMARRHLDRHGATVALHYQQLAPVTLSRQLAGKAPEITIDDRLHEAVDGGGRSALVLAVLGQQLGAHRHVRVRPRRGHQIAGPTLVTVVDVGVDEVDDEGLDALRAERLGGAAYLALVERDDHLTLGVDPLGHLQAQLARDEWLERALEAVRRRSRAPAELEHIAEAARGDEARAGTLALEHRVGGCGGAVHDHPELAWR